MKTLIKKIRLWWFFKRIEWNDKLWEEALKEFNEMQGYDE